MLGKRYTIRYRRGSVNARRETRETRRRIQAKAVKRRESQASKSVARAAGSPLGQQRAASTAIKFGTARARTNREARSSV